MRQKPGTRKPSAETVVKDIRWRKRKHQSAEDKTRMVLEGLRGEDSIAERCRRDALRAGDVWVESSAEYRSFEN